MAAMWPSPVDHQELLDYSQIDRPDGYDYTLALRFTHPNGVESVWRASGKVYHRSWGQESTVEFTAQGIPPSLTMRGIPKRIDTRIVNGQVHGDMKDATIEQTVTYLDGHTETSKQSHKLVATMPQFSKEQKIQLFKRASAGEALDQLIFGRKIKPN